MNRFAMDNYSKAICMVCCCCGQFGHVCSAGSPED